MSRRFKVLEVLPGNRVVIDATDLVRVTIEPGGWLIGDLFTTDDVEQVQRFYAHVCDEDPEHRGTTSKIVATPYEAPKPERKPRRVAAAPR